jgi:hypothetical protein
MSERKDSFQLRVERYAAACQRIVNTYEGSNHPEKRFKYAVARGLLRTAQLLPQWWNWEEKYKAIHTAAIAVTRIADVLEYTDPIVASFIHDALNEIDREYEGIEEEEA